jgi:hypothetical protein
VPSLLDLRLKPGSFGYDTLLRRTNSIPHLISKLREKEIKELVQQNKVLVDQALQLRQQGKLSATLGAAFKLPPSSIVDDTNLAAHTQCELDTFDGTLALAILKQLHDEPAFRSHLPSSLDACHLSLVSSPSQQTRQLCAQQGIQLPRIIPACDCWGSEPPQFHDVWLQASRVPKKGELHIFAWNRLY